MLKTLIKYKVIETAINQLFDKIQRNFISNHDRFYNRTEICRIAAKTKQQSIILREFRAGRLHWKLGDRLQTNHTITHIEVIFNDSQYQAKVYIHGTNNYFNEVLCVEADEFMI